MRVKLFQSRKYDFVWPEDSKLESGVEPVPPEEKITIHCQRLAFDDKRDVEDSMIEVSGKRLQRASNLDEVGMNYTIGAVKKKRIRASVIGWENVLDEEGNPIKFKLENFYELLMCNANLSAKDYGSLEEALLEKIDEVNTFADSIKINPDGTEKN